MRTRITVFHLLLTLIAAVASARLYARDFNAVVEVEEDVYTYAPANNGSGPMWCFGNTSIVRSGNSVFASGLETIAGAKPLNNCVPLLFFRSERRWSRVFRGNGRTREPSPLTLLPGGRVCFSINPTQAALDAYSGPARPDVLEFSADAPDESPRALELIWAGQPDFTEHSYRSFVADGANGELLLLQNIGYTHAEWSFRDQGGHWSAQGQLVWPWGAEYEKPKPIRVCYPTVSLSDRRVFFCGVSDIIEPNPTWREFKKELTGRDWDYDFRRLFYTWSDNITTGKFHAWVEVSSRDKTAGWISPNDLFVAANGDVFVLWTERALDERLRQKFFPEEKQRYSLECAVLRDGNVIHRTTLAQGGEGLGGLRPGRGRFHVAADGRLVAFYFVGGTDDLGQPVSENRMVGIDAGGKPGEPIRVKLQKPLSSFFTATVRAGCRPSDLLDLFGDIGGTMRYVRIRLR